MFKYKNNKWEVWIALYFLLFLLFAGGVTFAQSSATHIIKKSVFDQAGKLSQSSGHKIIDAIGQPIPVGVVSSANYQLASGFLAGGKTKEELPIHWNFTTNTNNNATVVLPVSANPNIAGSPLVNDDYVGVFTPSGLCCGWEQWQGENMSITVWGDDNQTTQIDGFRPGELINYRVFRMNQQKEWNTVEVSYSQGTGSYTANDIKILSQFDVSDEPPTLIITLNLDKGWNMFSINVNPDNPDMATIIKPIENDVVIIKNGSGNTFIPEYEINNIGDIDYKQGYQAYLEDSAQLDVEGQYVDPSTPISLKAGWSMIGYLPTVPIDADTALVSIKDNLVIAKNNSGGTYFPDYGINSIGKMKPGQGYQVYLESAVTLIYPPGGRLLAAMGLSDNKNQLTDSTQFLTEHFQFTDNTGENATLIIPLDIEPQYLDGSPLRKGDEIGVFTTDSLCCGAVVWDSTNSASITVWGDDSQTDSVDGFKTGDSLHFVAWRKIVDKEFSVVVSYVDEQHKFYKSNGISILTELIVQFFSTGVVENKNFNSPTHFELFQNFPNPFNPETTIEYHVAKAGHIKVAVYNLLGQQIKTLIDENQQPGIIKLMWQGKNSKGEKVPSGMYFYRMEADGFSQVRKMLLLE